MKLYRAAGGNYLIKEEDNTHVLSDADIMYSSELVLPSVLIWLSRVSLLCRIVIKGSGCIIGLTRSMSQVASG